MKIALLNKGYNLSEYIFEIQFPGEVEIMPPIGTKVTPETVVASGSSHTVKETINLIEFFGKLTKADLDAGITCFEGEFVKKSTVVFSKSLFGMGKRDIKTTSEGLISLSEISRGKILILDTKQKVTLKAGITGEVTGIYPEGVVHVTAPAYSLELFRVFGKKAGGLVVKLSKDDFEIQKKILVSKKDLLHQIAVTDFPLNKDTYKAVLIAGANAVISPSVESEFFKSIDKLKRINISLFEGWGRIFGSKTLAKFVEDIDGTYVEIIPGGTKTYYGRIVTAVIPEKSDTDKDILRVDAKIGDLVQMFEPPYWSKEGEIVDILEKDELISVRLKSGDTLVVPPQSLYKVVL